MSLVCKVRVSLCVSCMSSEGLVVCLLYVSGDDFVVCLLYVR